MKEDSVPCELCEGSKKEAVDIITAVGKEPEKAIPLLQEIQRRHGYLPEAVVEAVAEEAGIPLSNLYGVATFYSQFRFTPSGRHLIKVCKGTACHVAGSEMLFSVICEELGLAGAGTTADRLFTLESVACLGCCSLAPVIMIGEKVYGKVSSAKIRKILKRYRDE